MRIETKDDINKLIGGSENAEVEFKSAKGGLPESFWESFSAFANTNGGVIVLGVKEKNGMFIPDGLTREQIVSYKKRFWDCAHNKEKVSATMLVERDIKECDMDGNYLLVFRIPRASYNLRPVYLTRNPFGNTYKRNHEGDYHCTDTEVRQMFADAHHSSLPFDNQILPNYTMDDIDGTSLKGYRQRFMLKKENHPWNDIDDITFLTKLGAYRIDRETGEEGFTRAGILMFGKTESITDQVCTPWYFVDYQEKLGDDPRQRWSDRIYPDGTWEANIYQFFYRVYTRISQSLPVPFQLDGIMRQEETTAHIALREALVNTLVHCSYAEQGNIVIIREKDRITMRNPGRMLISVEDFYAGSQSVCRNPVLQKFFIQLGYGEKAGSGADTIVKGWEDNKWERPRIEEKVQPDTVTLTFELKDLKKIDVPSLSQPVLSLSSVCPQLSLALSSVCPRLEQASREKAAMVLSSLVLESKSISALMEIVKEKNKNRFRQSVLSPLIDSELVEPTIQDKPNSPKQRYRLTEKGDKLMNEFVK